MRSHILTTSLALLTPALALTIPEQRSYSVWNLANFKSLITFGDSYTDENNLNYYAAHNGTAPPTGTLLPETFSAPSGGRTWPRYVVQYAGSESASSWQPKLTLYDYAVSGAVCSNDITPRTLTGNILFPDVLNYETNNFIADTASGVNRNGTSTPFFGTSGLSASSAVYSLWIGTNDLGVSAFLTASQVRGKTLTDYTNCIYAVFDKLYASGARVFVLFNNAPLHLTPLYANETLNGVHANEYWPNKPSNITAIAETMHEYTSTVNDVFKYQTPYELLIAGRYPGASVAVFNVNQLLADIYHHPTQYLNGTQPANVTGFEHHCNLQRANCTLSYNGTSPDSFMWYDELHPSEQTDRIIAQNFIDILNGNSSYAQYW